MGLRYADLSNRRAVLMNVADYVVLGIVFMCVVLAVVCMIINRRKRNKGQHTGCGDCTQCTECNRNADGN
jgi:hypothetical protein